MPGKMQVCGFTILRDGVRFGYPFVESIKSLLPLVDRLVVQVGDCTDSTLDVLNQIDSSKIEILQSVWDPEMRRAGEVLSYQTNMAMDRCDGDWCFYLQADEVIHEADYPALRRCMEENLDRPSIDGIRFRYLHFRGDYNIRDPLGYRSQVRIVRRNPSIRSVGDACGFGRNGGRLRTVDCGARIFHYGFVRPPRTMAAKTLQFRQFYLYDKRGRKIRTRDDNPLREELDFIYNMNACVPYEDTHPAIMAERIAAKDWETPQFHHTPLWRNRYWWRGRLSKIFPRLFPKEAVTEKEEFETQFRSPRTATQLA